MSKTDASLVITIDLGPFMRVMRQVAQAVGRISNTFHELTTREGQLRRRRRVTGGMGRDAKAWPGQWQSTICAGLLCSITPCPSDANGLECTHSCHETAA